MEEGEAAQISTLGSSVVLLARILPQVQKSAKAESDSESWCMALFETTLPLPTQLGRFQCSPEDRPNTESSINACLSVLCCTRSPPSPQQAQVHQGPRDCDVHDLGRGWPPAPPTSGRYLELRGQKLKLTPGPVFARAFQGVSKDRRGPRRGCGVANESVTLDLAELDSSSGPAIS